MDCIRITPHSKTMQIAFDSEISQNGWQTRGVHVRLGLANYVVRVSPTLDLRS